MLGSKPPLVTQLARTGLGTRLSLSVMFSGAFRVQREPLAYNSEDLRRTNEVLARIHDIVGL